MSGVGNVGASQQIQEKKPIQNNSEAQAAKTAQDGVSVFTQNLVEGKGLDDALMATNQMIQKSITGALKSAATQFLKMLLGGNDGADAAKDAAKTGADVAKTSKVLTELQSKLIDGSIAALEELLINGEIDMQTYVANLSQTAMQVGLQGEEALAFKEEKSQKEEELEEIKNQLNDALKEAGLSMENTKDGPIIKDKDGNEVALDSDKNENNEAMKKVADLFKQYNAKSLEIAGLTEVLNSTIKAQEEVSAHLAEGITDVALRGEELGTVIVNQATEMINNGINEVTNTMMEQIGILQSDAVTNHAQAAVDVAAEAASVPIAAGITASTLGTGSGQAATVLANGVADGIAAGVRTATGSSALAGIVSGVAGGKTLSAAISSTLAQEAQNLIQGQVNELTSGLKEELLGQKETIDTSHKTLSEGEVKEDKKSA